MIEGHFHEGGMNYVFVAAPEHPNELELRSRGVLATAGLETSQRRRLCIVNGPPTGSPVVTEVFG